MTQSYLAKQVQDIKPSGIRKFFDLASKMDNVISLGVGEPDFVTPWNVIEASYHSLEQGYTAYTANAGLLELREEISKYLYETFDISYNPETQLLVTVGASQAIDVALRTILDQGDEVIIVEPCFVSYGPAVSLAGGVPVSVSATADNAFKITPEQVEAAITPRTKAIVMCSPNNPTGAVLSKKELTAVAKVIEKHDLVVLSDEIYAELSYDELASSMAVIEGMKERTIVISGFSKAFAMTGWRLGYVAGPVEILAAMTKIHQYTIMCAPTMAQHGALEALRNGNESVKEMKTSYRQRRNFVVKALNEMGLSCHLPGGAFYVFPSIQSTGFSSEEFAQRLLEEERVAVVPGHVFGESGEGYIRCSYATSIKQLDEAMKRMKRFVKRHSKTNEPTV
ncbi:aminotransferase [Gracilibacillus caseinilyticus]|uniref:Aminotransferase n=1 Tax=Gracilibacillus caseinilyticus TaxID=2932256 RepID=A0ABY4F1A2_9BACI|nr:aminotransferase [Gracilibacillus caseinilyticus]UOQ49996.1 aminotransferase [Gracilibacillus caseinilyticus]